MSNNTDSIIHSKGRRYSGSLIQCTCGEIYPIYILQGGDPIIGGETYYTADDEPIEEFEDSYCPYCYSTDVKPCHDIATAWNFQQSRIDALIAALELTRQDVTEIEKSRKGTEESLISAVDHVAELESLCINTANAMRGVSPLCVKLPSAYTIRSGHPIYGDERSVMIPKESGNWLSRFDVEHVLRIAGITVERS